MADKIETNIKNHGMSPAIRNSVCIDMDGVLVDFYNCPEKCDYSKYPNTALHREKCPVMHDAAESVSSIKTMGYKIIIQTGRVEAEREVTEKWLHDHNIIYDELIMGKPHACIYIDDFGYRFDNWSNTKNFITCLKKKIMDEIKIPITEENALKLYQEMWVWITEYYESYKDICGAVRVFDAQENWPGWKKYRDGFGSSDPLCSAFRDEHGPHPCLKCPMSKDKQQLGCFRNGYTSLMEVSELIAYNKKVQKLK